jgi:hypothetical protein
VDTLGNQVGRSLHLALPGENDGPPIGFELLDCSAVPGDVVQKLHLPEVSVRLWGGRQPTTFVSMPIAAMHEDSDARSRKDDVGAAWQTSHVKAIPQAQPMQHLAKPQLRRRIAA